MADFPRKFTKITRVSAGYSRARTVVVHHRERARRIRVPPLGLYCLPVLSRLCQRTLREGFPFG